MPTLDPGSPRITSDPSAWDLDPETEVHVARLFLAVMTPDGLRARIASGVCGLEHISMFRRIADAMESLLAGGFDPEAFAMTVRASAPVPAAA
jgi:hypothetical protein